MRLVANESTVPRLHLIGTLSIVFVLTLALGAFFSWQSVLDQRASFKRVESASVDQQNLIPAFAPADLSSAAGLAN